MLRPIIALPLPLLAAAGFFFPLAVAATHQAQAQLGYNLNLEAGQLYDDNIFLQAGGGQGDTVSELKPGARLLWQSPRLKASVGGQTLMTFYWRHWSAGNLKKVSPQADLTANYLLSPRLTLDLADHYALTPASESIPDFSRIHIFQNNLLTLSPVYVYETSERTRWRASLRGQRRDIWEVNGDYFNCGGEVRAEHDLNPIFHLTLSHDVERRQYDDLAGDYTLYTVYAGLKIDLSQRLEAQIPVGYQLLKLAGNGYNNNYSYQVTAKYFATPRLTATGDFSQRYQTDLSGRSYDSRHFGVGLKYELSPRMALSGEGVWRDFDYCSQAQTQSRDRLWQWSGQVSYAISETAEILLKYEGSHNGGREVSNDNSVNRGGLYFRYSFERMPQD